MSARRETRLNFLPLAHRHRRCFPSPRLHHGSKFNVERQHILGRPDPDGVDADSFCFLRRHAYPLDDPFERLCDRIDVESRLYSPAPPGPSSNDESTRSRCHLPDLKQKFRSIEADAYYTRLISLSASKRFGITASTSKRSTGSPWL
jgi:hypothetical protein